MPRPEVQAGMPRAHQAPVFPGEPSERGRARDSGALANGNSSGSDGARAGHSPRARCAQGRGEDGRLFGCPRPGPCLKTTTSSSWSHWRAAASHRQPLFLSPAMLLDLLDSGPHRRVLTRPRPASDQAQYLHAAGAFLLCASHRTASRAQHPGEV